MRIAVAGGTGLVGAKVVALARAAGHEVRSLSRADGVDLRTGEGLDLAGVDAVVDVLNAPGISRKVAVPFFERTTGALLAAGAAAGVSHHLVLSIVGVDRVPTGYYASKLRQEELVATGDVPWTVLRATQFHEFPGQLLSRARGRVVPVPLMRSATVAADEVARHLLELTTGTAQGFAPEISGPEVAEMPDLVRRLLAADGRRALVVPVRLAREMANGGLLPERPGVVGQQTFEQWLRARAAQRGEV